MIARCLTIAAVFSLGGCYGLYGNDEMDRYVQRSDTITMSAGDAKQVNAVTHTITPWPYYVGDRRIAYDSRRAISAVQRYGATRQPVDPLPDMGDATRQMGQRPPLTTHQIITSDQTINESVSGQGIGQKER